MQRTPDHLLEHAKERFELQDYYGAIHYLDELIESGQAFADGHHLLGLCYSLLGQSDRALGQFDRAIGLNPRYVEAHMHRAIVLNDLGRSEDADQALSEARRLVGKRCLGLPAHLAAKLANRHAELGEAYWEAGALERAIEQYQSAIALGPAFHDLRVRLGRLLLEAGRVLDAREQFETVVRERPDFGDATASLGLACYLSGDGLAARTVWEDHLHKKPSDRRVKSYLAMLERAGT